MSARLAIAIPAHLPSGATEHTDLAGIDAGSVLDPSTLAQLPAGIATAVRRGLADAVHDATDATDAEPSHRRS
jgi:hypothetical protein